MGDGGTVVVVVVVVDVVVVDGGDVVGFGCVVDVTAAVDASLVGGAAASPGAQAVAAKVRAAKSIAGVLRRIGRRSVRSPTANPRHRVGRALSMP